jgi:hypothetical protein
MARKERTYYATVTQKAAVDPSQSRMPNGIITSTWANIREERCLPNRRTVAKVNSVKTRESLKGVGGNLYGSHQV